MSNDIPPDGTYSTRLFHCLKYEDAPAAIDWLESVLGFRVAVRYDDNGLVGHCELAWSGGGGVMLGSVGAGSADLRPGGGIAYLVTDDIDAAWARVREAGVEAEIALRDTDYRSREFLVRDPEGNHWSVGTYPGAPTP